MGLEGVYVPYGGYWSTPFCRWQGSYSHLHSIRFAADVATSAMKERGIGPECMDGVVLGMTVPQHGALFGAPWLAGLVGAPGVTGPTINQACATSARVVANAALEVSSGSQECVLALTCDRTSNSPHIYYPNQMGIGGVGEHEDWVWDSFNRDPYAKNSMLQTAENVAREAGISREEQEQVVLTRHAQYEKGLADDRAFQKRYMVSVEVKDPSGRKVLKTVDSDEGVFPTTEDGLKKLRPVLPEGTVTFGTQTFPGDGNAALFVTNRAKADELSRDKKVQIRVLSFGQARTKKGFMAMSVAPAAKLALDRAKLDVKDVAVIKTHNPFAVNDIHFARELEIGIGDFNDYGSPLIYGHPQGPTGTRAMIELIEELVLRGGGNGLFSGCAAGDSAMAVTFRVDVS